jgi:hypothetical protein
VAGQRLPARLTRCRRLEDPGRITILRRAARAAAVVLLASLPASAQVQPEDRAAFERMAPALEQASSLTVRAWTSYDVVRPDGQKLRFHGSADVQRERPGRLHARARRHGTDREVWLRDGQVTLLDLGEKTGARVEGPPTVDGMLDLPAQTHGFSMPLADLLYSDVDGAIVPAALGGARQR